MGREEDTEGVEEMTASIRIDERTIGDGNPCYVIAEAGLNHDGKVEQAKELVEAAKKCRADMVKFQIYRTPELCSRSSKAFPIFQSLELSANDWKDIAVYASKVGMAFSASVFGSYGLELIKEMGCGCIKTASSDITYGQFLASAARTGLPMVVSTGMSYLGEVEEALCIIRSEGNENVALLHCVSNYPTSEEDANLRAMLTMKKSFGVPVGFSDHTMDDLVPLTAVALGANIIEKHFTLDRGLPGPDHKLSMVPEEFEKMVRDVRRVEKALGSGAKVPVEKEIAGRKSSRRSVVTNHDIKVGSVILAEDVRLARPGSGLGPSMFDVVIGRKAQRDISADSPLTWNDI